LVTRKIYYLSSKIRIAGREIRRLEVFPLRRYTRPPRDSPEQRSVAAPSGDDTCRSSYRVATGGRHPGQHRACPGRAFSRKNPARQEFKEDKMAEISFQGKTFEVDEDGFLLRFEDWSPEWVEYVRKAEGISGITPEHRKILEFLQDYYKKNGIAPMVRILSKNTGFKLKEVYELFPSGPGKGACKMAGLPKPTGCV
jgi:tRNA 2-thiouridine synthesizing protein E